MEISIKIGNQFKIQEEFEYRMESEGIDYVYDLEGLFGEN